MAPTASKKGTQARASGNRSASRHSTPLTDTAPPTPLTATPSTTAGSVANMPKDTPYLHTSTSVLISSEPSIEALIEKGSASTSKAGDPPGARELNALNNKIRDTINQFMNKREDACNRGVRQLAQKRKERNQMEQEEAAARAEEQRAKLSREEERHKEKRASSKKRSHDAMETDQDEKDRKEKREHLPSVGAHGVARQDGVGVHEGAQAPPSPTVQPGTVPPDLMDTADSPSGSEASRLDPPSTAPLYERIFGKDPTKTDDPIIYDIRDTNDDMTNEEKGAIFNVAQWPESDLSELTAGDPPDMDFSNAKPANQVNFSTFQTYIEPYIRAFTEEDVAFLKERGDRFAPYVIPQRGPKGYKDVWAIEDGATGIEPPQKHTNNPNEARGSMEDLEDDLAETDHVSMGPVTSRILSTMRPATSGVRKDDVEDANGDVSMTNGDTDAAGNSQAGSADDHKPASCLPADAPRPANLPQLDYDTFEQRALQELRHIGILAPNEIPEYAAHDDDEVAARLRTLQHELRRVSHLNNVRKARVLELTEARMAMQEYSNIADDLDTQVNAAYLKRNRSLGKPYNKKGGSHQARPGQKGVASGVLSGRGVSDGVRALMQKRRDWIDMVGPVVGFGRPPIPGDTETIFDEASMKQWEKAEREAEMADAEGD